MDPRRPGYNPDYAQKRKPSNSPPNGAPSKVQKTVNVINSTGTPSSGGPAPPAPMTTDSLVDMLMAFGNQCSTVATTNVNQKQAQAALDRANVEYRKMSEHFQTFPQIKEQKTAAKTRAERTLKAVSTELDQQKSAQKTLATSIATIVQKAQPVTSIGYSTADLKRVEQKCNSLEKKLDSLNSVSAADFQRIEKKCNDLAQQVGDLSNMMNGYKSTEGQIKNLQRKNSQSDKDLRAIDSRLSSLQDHVTGRSGDSLQNKVLALIAKAEQSQPESGPIMETKRADTWTGEAIEARFQLEKDLTQDENQKRDLAIAQYVEDQISAVNEKIAAVEQQITTISDARERDAALVSTLRNDMRSDMSAVKDKLAAVEDQTKDYESTKSAVFDQAKEISSLKGEISTKVDRNFVAGAVQKVVKEQSAVQPVQPPSRTPTPGVAHHGPSNGNVTPQVNGFHSQVNPTGQPRAGSFSNPPPSDSDKRIADLQQTTDMLSLVTQRLQHQYNNLTTENVCQAMLDQLGEVWPHAKNWEGWISELKTRQAEFDRQRGDLKTALTRLGIDAGMALRAANGAINTAKEAKETSAAATRVGQEANASGTTATQVAKEAKETTVTALEVANNAKKLAEQHAGSCEKLRLEIDGVTAHLLELESRGQMELADLGGKVKAIATEVSTIKGTFEAWKKIVPLNEES